MLSEREIVSRLKKAYREKIWEYLDATRSGSGRESEFQDTMFLLGDILGKDSDEIDNDTVKVYCEYFARRGA